MFFPRKTAVVDRRICSWKKIELTFDTESYPLAVTNAKGKIVFNVQKDDTCRFRSRRIIVDRSGNPVISLQSKVFTLHHRWHVFTGDSSEPKDLLFTVKRRSMFRRKTEFDVFLASNTREEAADFKIQGSYRKKKCSVVDGKGTSSKDLAQMSRGYKDAKSSVSAEGFGVTVNRRMDKAFVTALVVILCEIKKREKTAAATVPVILEGVQISLDIAQLIFN